MDRYREKYLDVNQSDIPYHNPARNSRSESKEAWFEPHTYDSKRSTHHLLSYAFYGLPFTPLLHHLSKPLSHFPNIILVFNTPIYQLSFFAITTIIPELNPGPIAIIPSPPVRFPRNQKRLSIVFAHFQAQT